MSKSLEAEVSVLQSQMTEVKEQLTGLKADTQAGFKELSLKIDTLHEQGSILQLNRIATEELERRVSELEKRKTFQTYFIPSATAVLGSLFTYLITAYLKGVR